MGSKNIYDYVKGLEKGLRENKEKYDKLVIDYISLFTEYEIMTENANTIARLIPECPHMKKGFNYVSEKCESCEFSNSKKNYCWALWLRGAHDELDYKGARR